MTQLSRGVSGDGRLSGAWGPALQVGCIHRHPSGSQQARPSLGSSVLICSVKGLDSLRSTEVMRLRSQKPLQLVESIWVCLDPQLGPVGL